jgi:Lar family restriction alleviation protein
MIPGLRRCPFCGNQNAYVTQLHMRSVQVVVCGFCQAQGPEVLERCTGNLEEAREEAARLWNERWTLVKTTTDGETP